MYSEKKNTQQMYVHRGVHAHAGEENTLRSFASALKMGLGFECDVRMSREGSPVIVHDSTLLRTHGISKKRVQDLSVQELSSLGVPTLEQALALITGGGRAVLDLKVSPDVLIRKVARVARRMGLHKDQLTLLVWSPTAERTEYRMLRGKEFTFRMEEDGSDGVACKFDGSRANVECIHRALSRGWHVNLWSPNPALVPHMIRQYGSKCSITLDVQGTCHTGP